MVKNIVYYTSIISFIFMTFLTIEMLPLIYQTGNIGIIYIILEILVILIEILLLIFDKKIIKKMFYHNIYIITATLYLCIIYYKIYTSNLEIYNINIKYCKDNYLILAFVFLFIILNMIVSKLIKKTNKRIKL